MTTQEKAIAKWHKERKRQIYGSAKAAEDKEEKKEAKS